MGTTWKTRISLYGGMACLAIALAACAPTAKVTSTGGQDIESARMEAYNGPKARIAVSDFEDKMSSSGYYNAEYGRGMSDMLTTALFETNRYIVLEREKIQSVLAEQNLGASGRVKRETAAAVGEIEGAELLVTAAITGFDPGASGGGGGLGGIIGGNLGAVVGAFKKAHVAMDLRVVDTNTARVLLATSVEGSATAFGGGGLLAGGAMGGGLGGFQKTPMETAIRKMIQEAVKVIAARTPASYYHFSASGAPIGVAASAAPAPPAAQEAVAPKPKKAAPSERSTAKAQPDEMGTPKARKALQSIRSNLDNDLIAHLNEVKRRGSVVSVTVSLSYDAKKKESEFLRIDKSTSHVLDYQTGENFEAIKVDGFTSGRLKPGEVKTLQATFKAPKDASTIGITLGGLGTFDDVSLKE